MALRFAVGDHFPSHTLCNEQGRSVSIDEVAGGQPLILAFFRGPW